MIRLQAFLVIGVCLTAIGVFAATERLYTDKYDNIDYQSILDNNMRRNQYYNCFIDKGPCITADSKFIKSILAEIFFTRCRRCTEKQKDLFLLLTEWYTTNRPEEWLVLVTHSIEEARRKNIRA